MGQKPLPHLWDDAKEEPKHVVLTCYSTGADQRLGRQSRAISFLQESQEKGGSTLPCCRQRGKVTSAAAKRIKVCCAGSVRDIRVTQALGN